MYEDKLAFCLKISQPVWIEKLYNGEAWFGKINGFIEQAEKEKNNEQGDKYEGVFARCKRASPLVIKYSNLLGADLEIIDDGDFCMLRRKSSRLMKVFCMYGIRNSDLEITEVMDPEATESMVKYRYNVSEKMYKGFLQDGISASEVAGFYASAGHINEAIEKSLLNRGDRWARAMVQYDIDLASEFCIDISQDYPELWHKRKDLSYQHESRIVIYDFDDTVNGILVPYHLLDQNSANWAIGELYFEGTAHATQMGSSEI